MKELWMVAAPASTVLTLITWLFFLYAPSISMPPLDKSETTLVFAFWFTLILAVRWVWRRIFKKPAGEAPHHDVPQS